MSELYDSDEFFFDTKLAERVEVIAKRIPSLKLRKYRWQEMEAM